MMRAFQRLKKLLLQLLPKRFHISSVSYAELHCSLETLSIARSKKQVLLFLKQSARFFDVAQVSLKRIKKGTSFSERTVRLAITFWKASGVIEVVNRKDRRGTILTNRYILHLENLKCLEFKSLLRKDI